MGVAFRCSACGGTHPARVRALTEQVFHRLNDALGPTLEPCPHTDRWVRCAPADRHWAGRAASPPSRIS